MDMLNTFLLIITGLVLGLSIFVYLRNRKSSINISFSLVTLFGAIWSFGLAMFRFSFDLTDALIWAKIYYIAAELIAASFLYFAFVFPYQSSILSNKKKIFIILPSFIILMIVLIPDLLFNQVKQYAWGKEVTLNFGYYIYSLYFLIYITWSYVILFKKFKNSDGVIRIQLKYVIIGTLIPFSFGSLFNLFFPFFGNYKLIWLGPYFMVFVVYYIAYLIFEKSR